MNKDLVRLAMIGLAAGFCLSAQASPTKDKRELAMAKCTKDNSKNGDSCDDSSSCGGKSNCNSCNSSSSYNPGAGAKSNESTAATEVKHKRKSAARKVLEGQ